MFYYDIEAYLRRKIISNDLKVKINFSCFLIKYLRMIYFTNTLNFMSNTIG